MCVERVQAETGAVAVSGGLRDGAGQRAAARLGGELAELLLVLLVGELDLLREQKAQS